MIDAATFLALIDALEVGVNLHARLKPAADKVRVMVEEGREPTPAEWGEMMDKGQADFDAIMKS